MKNYFVITFLSIIALFLCINNSYSQSDDHINAVITGIPHEILANESADITVTVYNKTKDMNWSSSQLKMEVTGPFTVVNKMQSERTVTIEPGQSGNIILTITPAAEGGKHEFTIILYNNDIKLARETKNIDILAVTRKSDPIEIKPEDESQIKKDDDGIKKDDDGIKKDDDDLKKDDGIKTDDDKDKVKGKDKHKNKDKDKGHKNGKDK